MSDSAFLWRRYLKFSGSGILVLGCAITLTLLGLVVLSSASQSASHVSDSIFYKQLIWLVFAVAAGLFGYCVNLEKFREKKWLIAVGIMTFLGLILVLIPGIGIRVNGAQRWINLGIMRLQISEWAKVGLVIMLSSYMARNQRHLQEFFKGFFIPSCIIGSLCILILLEPDFGTAFLCGIVGLSIMFMAGVGLRYLIPTLVGSMSLFAVAISLDPVRLKRITSFLDIEGNKSEGSYQLWQGILGFGAGGMNGLGLGNGLQKMSFLPEAHTDFIFPVIGEELGFFFSILVVVLFLLIFVVGIVHLKRAPNLYQFSLALGSLLFIVLQSLINIGVVTGCLPTKGISLPFISYGGSNLVVMFFFIGLILNCFRAWGDIPIKKVREL